MGSNGLHLGHDSRKDFVCRWSIAENRVEGPLRWLGNSLPDVAKVWRRRRRETLFDLAELGGSTDALWIPAAEGLSKLSFASGQVCAIVTVDNSWLSSTGDEATKSIDERRRVHTVGDLDVHGSSHEAS